MAKVQSVAVACPECGGDEFEILIMKDEEVGAAKCRACSRDFLILDSGDYWFDVIQQGYPKPSRCPCKAPSFKLRIDYSFRDDGDVKKVVVWSACSSCGKAARRFSADIDYSPTQELVDQPLTFCKNPKILYDLKELTLYATRSDITRVAKYLGTECGCSFVGWLRKKDEWVRHELDLDDVQETILHKGPLHYMVIYAVPARIPAFDAGAATSKQEDAFWKRHEIIRIDAPTQMVFHSKVSLLYYIHFSNEYVKDEKVIAKSKRFRAVTKQLVDWLKTEFVDWRGPDCFDNPRENVRAFGDEFKPKKQ